MATAAAFERRGGAGRGRIAAGEVQMLGTSGTVTTLCRRASRAAAL